MSSFVLKIIACISMFIDHFGYISFNDSLLLNYIGRFAFPIFAFQISEGYIYTKSIKKYFLRLFIFGIISQVPYMLFISSFSHGFSLNIFYTLILGLFCILIYDKLKCKFINLLLCFLIAMLAHFIKCDYGFYGVSIILLFYIFRENRLYMALSFILATLAKYAFRIIVNGYNTQYLYLYLFTSISIIFICLYNKKKGKNTRYFLYLFYPIHLLLFYLINCFI